MRKEVTVIINSLQGGGAEKVSLTISNHLSKNGFDVNFVVMNLSESVHHDLLERNIRFYNLNVNHARNSFFVFRGFLKKVNPKTILVFNHELAVVLVILRILLKKNFTIIARNINTLSENRKHEGSFWHKHLKDIIIRHFYNYVDLIIAQSKMMKADLIDHYRILEDKIVVINNPVSVEFEQISLNCESIPIKRDEILFVGRLEKQKGLKFLFDAFKDVVVKEPKIILRMIGTGSLKEKLVDYSDLIGIKKNVIFEGFIKEIIPYFRRAKLTVLSSLYEGFPNVLVESTYCGTPVVSFNCKSGPKEIVVDGVNGFLVEYLNTKQLTEKIIEALYFDWDFSLVQQSAQRFSSGNIMKQYIEMLSQFIN